MKIDIEKLKELCYNGYSNREIAKIFNVSRYTIRYWRRKLNLPRCPRKGGKQQKVNIEKLKELYENNVPIKEIAKYFNVSKCTIYYHLRKLKIAKRKKALTIKTMEIKEEIIKFLKERGFATHSELVNYFKINENSLRRCLYLLEKENKIKMFRTFVGTRSGRKYRFYDLFLFKRPELLYYIDEKEFIKNLIKFINVDNIGKIKSLTFVLKNNGISDEGIKLFHTLIGVKNEK